MKRTNFFLLLLIVCLSSVVAQTNANQVITDVNQKIFSGFGGVDFLNLLGWIVFAIIIIGASFFGYLWWKNGRLFNKNVTAFEIISGQFDPSIRDKAKSVKLGSGGFEIVYLKKLKTWKIAYGGRIGRNSYYFFIMPDGYWYNGYLSADLKQISKDKGYVPVVTTNPLMRGQYTALEEQINGLGGDKKGFWDQYGSWILGISFILIAGVFLWLNYRQFNEAMGSLGNFLSGLEALMNKLNVLTTNVQTGGAENGLIKV